MKRSLKILLACLVLVLCGGSWYMYKNQQTLSVTTPNEASLGDAKAEGAAQAAIPDNAMNNAIGLALQGISLFQGNKGAELWRLKASWAHLSQTGDVINVDLPVVRYLLGEPGSEDFLAVVSEKGQVTDNQRHLTLWGHVRLTHFDEVVTGSKLHYDAATRVMVFPEGAALDGPTASGTATLFTWNLENNVMVGENGVNVVLKPRRSSEPALDSETVEVLPVEVGGLTVVEPVNASAAPVVSSMQKKNAKQPAEPKKTGSKKQVSQKKPQTKSTNDRKKQSAAQPRN